MERYFNGYYFKHQKGRHTLCLIVSRSDHGRLIQVVTEEFAEAVPLTEGNYFSPGGIRLNIHSGRLSLTGCIRYGRPAPLRYDIMGPFALFPMECRHKVVSMDHGLEGKINLNGKTIDFTGGRGYIEGDSGRSFPSDYTWIQCNSFTESCSVMAAVAKIPLTSLFGGLHFTGCICAIFYGGREYRLATYLGARIVECSGQRMVLRQGKYRLEIRVYGNKKAGHLLHAPQDGKMDRRIREAADCPASFVFSRGGETIFHLYSEHAAFEYEKGQAAPIKMLNRVRRRQYVSISMDGYGKHQTV